VFRNNYQPNFNSPDFVIPSEARDLHFAASCRSLASLGMTKSLKVMLAMERITMRPVATPAVTFYIFHKCVKSR